MNESIILRFAMGHTHLEGVQKPKSNGRPKVLDTNEIQKNEPTFHLPNAAAQFANEMGFSITYRADDHAAQWLVVGIWVTRLLRKVVDKVVDPGSMERRDMIRRVAPNASQLAGPLKIN